jgi:hypothetical protein
MKVHVDSNLSYHIKTNLACGEQIKTVSDYEKRPQPLTSMISVDLNPEGKCENESSYILSVWNSLDAQGKPDSYIIADKDGNIKEKKERSIVFEDWNIVEPKVVHVRINKKQNIGRVIFYIIFFISILLLLFGIGILVYWMMVHGKQYKMQTKFKKVSFFEE